MFRLKILAIVLFVYFGNALAQGSYMQESPPELDFGEDNQQLEQKYKMANYLLGKSPFSVNKETTKNPQAASLYQDAKSNYQLVIQKIHEKSWVEANAIIDNVLRNLTASSRLLNQKNIDKNLYKENLKRVNSFIMPQWSELSDEDKLTLGNTNAHIDNLIMQAKKMAESDNYEDANAILYQAYNLKTQLLNQLSHESTVVYDLIFETAEEEYLYMVKRHEHYQELYDKVVSENNFNAQTLKLADTYIEKGRNGLKNAHQLHDNDRHQESVAILENTIKHYSTALKLLGIKF